MFSSLKFLVKELFQKIGIESFATKIWFQYLAIKFGVKYNFDNKNNKISISKKQNKLIIKGNSTNFGSSGIVLRDFDNVFNTVIPQIINKINIVDFSIPNLDKPEPKRI